MPTVKGSGHALSWSPPWRTSVQWRAKKSGQKCRWWPELPFARVRGPAARAGASQEIIARETSTHGYFCLRARQVRSTEIIWRFPCTSRQVLVVRFQWGVEERAGGCGLRASPLAGEGKKRRGGDFAWRRVCCLPLLLPSDNPLCPRKSNHRRPLASRLSRLSGSPGAKIKEVS
jgi:hypothetical protein